MKRGKGKIILAWVILLSIPLGGFFLQRHVYRLCDELYDLLDQSEDGLSPLPLEQAIDLWQDHQFVLTALIPHEEVDAVTQSLRKTLAFLRSGNAEEFYASIAETRADLKAVQHFDRPSVRTIF